MYNCVYCGALCHKYAPCGLYMVRGCTRFCVIGHWFYLMLLVGSKYIILHKFLIDLVTNDNLKIGLAVIREHWKIRIGSPKFGLDKVM